MARITQIRPMLAVTDLRQTMEFYCTKLGFQCGDTFGDPPVWCNLSRDGWAIVFNAPPADDVRRDVSRRSRDFQIYYFNSDDVIALHEEFSARGAPVSDLRVTAYGMKEFEVRDPDDIWLWFGQPTDETPAVQE